MPSPKDLTGSLAQWDKRSADTAPEKQVGMYAGAKGKDSPERKLNLDIFSGWVYTLLIVALLTQLAIIAALDII